MSRIEQTNYGFTVYAPSLEGLREKAHEESRRLFGKIPYTIVAMDVESSGPTYVARVYAKDAL